VHYQITHHITYTYDRPVLLAPHSIRMQPRSDVTQTLHQFSLSIAPEPKRWVENLDLDGNAVTRVWFSDQTVTSLTIEATSTVETRRTNPFDYLLEPWAVRLPVDYPVSLLDRLQPYLAGQFSRLTGGVDPAAVQLAQEVWEATSGNVVPFLSELTDRIYKQCGYQLRENGDALPAGITWTQKSGSCRDYAVLLIEVCRAVGLAARFVSGYQEGDVDSDDRHLHAWAEVYLPGAGWRGYDPTQGLATADAHIALVACPTYHQTAPVSGTLKQAAGVSSQMRYNLKITKM
jgi:transglutaminase-like putative cysteine protease